jgi:hypothetical protein
MSPPSEVEAESGEREKQSRTRRVPSPLCWATGTAQRAVPIGNKLI